jgi:hypothetical protein
MFAEPLNTIIAELARKKHVLNKNDFTKEFIPTRSKYGVYSKFKDNTFQGYTIAELYPEYLQRWEMAHIQYRDRELVGQNQQLPIAFKTPFKKQGLLENGYIDEQSEPIPQRFPLKLQSKRYTLHHVSIPNTWLVDVAFFGEFAYYLFINVNTRYLFMVPANAVADVVFGTLSIFAEAKESTNVRFYVEALKSFEQSGLSRGLPLMLRGDSEKAFTANDSRGRTIYKRLQATFEPVKRILLNTRRRQNTEPYHHSLSVVDSVIRTLRDMLYNIDRTNNANPAVMEELVKQYNNTIHTTLTKYGPGFKITPQMVQNDSDLELFICRRITQTNIITKTVDGFTIPIGSKVLVFNHIHSMDKRRSSTRPEVFEVTGFEHGIYTVKGMKSGVVLFAPRSEIKPKNEK